MILLLEIGLKIVRLLSLEIQAFFLTDFPTTVGIYGRDEYEPTAWFVLISVSRVRLQGLMLLQVSSDVFLWANITGKPCVNTGFYCSEQLPSRFVFTWVAELIFGEANYRAKSSKLIP